MGSTLRPPDAAGLITARGIPWARCSSRQVVDTGDRGLRGEESLLPRRTQRGNELRDLVAVARIAAGDALLDLVEQGDECVPGADAGEPCHGVDGLGEKADVLRGQPARIDVGDDLGGIERLGAEPVVHDIVPDLEDGWNALPGRVGRRSTPFHRTAPAY